MFKITDHIDFDSKSRAQCPCCLSLGKTSKNLSLIPNTDGAYKCHRGCSTEDIRAALGVEEASDRQIPIAIAKPPAKPKYHTPQQLSSNTDKLLNSTLSIKWLGDRGIDTKMITQYRLGVVVKRIDGKNYPCITIPYEINTGQYLQKYFVAPWLPSDQRPQRISQDSGLSARWWFTRKSDAKQLWICEGEWDAMLLTKYSTCDIATSTTGAGNIPSDLSELDRYDQIYIWYDLDEAGQKGVEKLAYKLGDRAKIATVPHPENCKAGYDISDAIKDGFTLEQFIEATKQAVKAKKPENSKAESKPKSFKRQILETIRKRYGNCLRLNAMSKNVEMDGIAIKPDYLYLELLEEDISASKDFISDTFYYLAQQNEYHPVQDYLKMCQRRYGTSTINLLDKPAQRYIGTTEPLYDVFLRKTLIAAVARTFSPGCKVDTALILQGDQGKRKSTFFKVLAGDWFDDSMSCNTTDKDEKLKLHATWFMEWAELETIFSRKDVSATKAFLSSSVDKFRAPFGRTTDNFPRHSIIVGTTNSDDFLQDSTGSRRFWVLPIPKNGSLHIDLLREERDKLWAAAITAYERGDQWWLTNEEEAINGNINQQFQRDDSWTSTIANYISICSEVSIKDVLADALGVTLDRQDRGMQMRVADILRCLGWTKKHTKHGKVWVRNEGKGSQVVTSESQQGLQDDYQMTTNTRSSHLSGMTTSDDPQKTGLPQKIGVVTDETVTVQGFDPLSDHLTQKTDHFKENFLENDKNDCEIFPKYKKVDPTVGATCAFKDQNVLMLGCTIIKDLGMKYYEPRRNLQVLYKVQMPDRKKTKTVFECDLQCYAESPDGTEDLLALLSPMTSSPEAKSA